ncbi:MAG: right-handed parallel beta-helix repeat-containing protein [Anaerolineae bacterium]|nr:right-handed parallel beta-helix repeat-containing protein [Anaerolineae bacterium]
MRLRRFHVIVSLGIVMGLIVGGGPPQHSLQAQPTVLYVAPSGACGSASPCYSTVQAAVDAAPPGAELRLATGVYTGINTQGGKAQVIYLAKNLTLRGGYTPTDWTTPDPAANVTTLDAQGLGRVAHITGNATQVTLTGLHLILGSAIDLGGHEPAGGNEDAGGNLYIDGATVTLQDCQIRAGVAADPGCGGGLYLRNGVLTATRTRFEENTAGRGSGAYFVNATTRLVESTFYANHSPIAGGTGPALTVAGGAFTLSDSTVVANTAQQRFLYSGALTVDANPFLIERSVISGTVANSGVYLMGVGVLRDSVIQGNAYHGVRVGQTASPTLITDITLLGNEIAHNGPGDSQATENAGLYVGLGNGAVTVQGNHIHHNQNRAVNGVGGGVYLAPGGTGLGHITLRANVIEHNTVGEPSPYGVGGGVYSLGDRVLLERNVIQHNLARGIQSTDGPLGGYGGGIYIIGNPTLANNVIVGNQATLRGSGIYIHGAAPTLYHTTLAGNQGAQDGVAIYLAENFQGQPAQAQLWNTIIVSQTVGIYVKGGVVQNSVAGAGLLWYGNTVNISGTGAITLTQVYTGAPHFAAPESDDYHLLLTSAALDRGVLTSVKTDLDGEPRFGLPDLGADEYIVPGSIKQVYLPLTLR